VKEHGFHAILALLLLLQVLWVWGMRYSLPSLPSVPRGVRRMLRKLLPLCDGLRLLNRRTTPAARLRRFQLLECLWSSGDTTVIDRDKSKYSHTHLELGQLVACHCEDKQIPPAGGL
jgi:hypothetical protein